MSFSQIWNLFCWQFPNTLPGVWISTLDALSGLCVILCKYLHRCEKSQAVFFYTSHSMQTNMVLGEPAIHRKHTCRYYWHISSNLVYRCFPSKSITFFFGFWTCATMQDFLLASKQHPSTSNTGKASVVSVSRYEISNLVLSGDGRADSPSHSYLIKTK